MLPNERANWTDEHLNPCGPPGEFQLPETPEGSGVRWRWVKGEEWEVEGGEKGNGTRRRAGSGAGKSGGVGGVTAKERLQEVMDRTGGPGEGGEGWWYYNNKVSLNLMMVMMRIGFADEGFTDSGWMDAAQSTAGENILAAVSGIVGRNWWRENRLRILHRCHQGLQPRRRNMRPLLCRRQGRGVVQVV